MLSNFERPPVVVCVLCHGTVSVRKGDKTRFYSHISQDHEVHYDLELFFALSHMTEPEKRTVVEVMKKRTVETTNNTEDNLMNDSIATENNDEEPQSNTLEETFIDANEAAVATDANLQTQVSTEVTEDTISNINVDSMKKEKEKCPHCDMMVPKKAIRIHMKLKHKLPFQPLKGFKTKTSSFDTRLSSSSCNICGKSMVKSSISRHIKRVHGNDHQSKAKVVSKVKSEPSTLNEGSTTADNIGNEDNSDNNDKQPKKPSVAKDDERIYRKCKLCFRTVKRSGYKNHLKDVHSGVSYPCDLCYHKFTRKINMLNHVDSVHKNDLHWLDEQKKAKFTPEECKVDCENCDKKFITEESMKFHSDKVHGNGNFECENCVRKFSDSLRLKKHQKICKVILMP